MKTLKEYLLESYIELNEANDESKTFQFDFSGINSADELIKSLEEIDCSCVSISDKKVTFTISQGCDIDSAYDILQQTIQAERKSQSSINNEQYAQKTKALATKLGEMDEFIDQVNNPEEPEEEPTEDKDKKEEE